MPAGDFVARINNDGLEPQLRAVIRVDSGGDWGTIEARFGKPTKAKSWPGGERFPRSLPPLALHSVPLR